MATIKDDGGVYGVGSIDAATDKVIREFNESFPDAELRNLEVTYEVSKNLYTYKWTARQ